MAQIPGSARVNQYTATAGQTVFTYDFKIYDDDEVMVQQGATTLTLTTEYTVQDAGEDAGGTITLVTGATLDDLITITGNSMIERDTVFTNGGDYLASAINGEYNKLDNIAKEIVTDQAGNFRLAIYNESVSKTIPEPSAGLALKWNATGTALENSTYDPDTRTAAAAASAAAAAASAVDAASDASDASDSADAAADSAIAASESADEAAASAASIDVAAMPSDIIPDADGTRSLGSTDVRWGNVWADTVNGIAPAATAVEYVQYRYQPAQGTNGGTYTTANTWQDRPMDDAAVIGGITGASMSSNILTLPAGTFDVYVKVWMYNVGQSEIRLYDGASITFLTARGGYIPLSNHIQPAKMKGTFTLAASATMTLQMKAALACATTGMGAALNTAGWAECFCELNITKIR